MRRESGTGKSVGSVVRAGRSAAWKTEPRPVRCKRAVGQDWRKSGSMVRAWAFRGVEGVSRRERRGGERRGRRGGREVIYWCLWEVSYL